VADVRPQGRYSAHDRVRKRSEYLRIQEGGHRVVSPGFVFMLDRSADTRGPRLGITASRRVGNAIERNRAKRLVREAFRAVRASWPPAARVVVIVRQGLGNRHLSDVVAEWEAARGRILRRFAELAETNDTRVPGIRREKPAASSRPPSPQPAPRPSATSGPGPQRPAEGEPREG
jgi:ribonuclease P protein component